MLNPHSVDAQRLLRFDSIAGLSAGVAVLLLRHPLSAWEQIPAPLLAVTGAANLLYGSYSGLLAYRASRGNPASRLALRTLVIANGGWAVFCLVLVAVTWSYSSWLGVAHLGGEGLFVGLLAYIESRVFLPRAA